MFETVDTFAIAVSPVGIKGLKIPRLGRGDFFEAIWSHSDGLRLRADRGTAWVKLDPKVMQEHWAGEAFLQIFETEEGQVDKHTLVPLTNAPLPLNFQEQSKVH